MTVIAIDQGTTSTRTMRLSESGVCEVVAVHEHQQHYPQSGWVEHDPLEIIGHIQKGLTTATDATALGIDNQGESCLAWHADTKEPVTNIIVWQDSRTLSDIDRLKAADTEELILSRAGLPLDPYFSASKLAWIVREIPEARLLLKQGKLRLGTTDAFFLDRLTGHYKTDITTASRTSLMNLHTAEWDTELCDLFGVPIEALPPINPTMSDFGGVMIAGRAVPVTASVVDQQASLYGHGCRQRGDRKITFGTGAFALVLTGDTLVDTPQHGLLPTVAWQQTGSDPVYALDGGVYCASSAVNWARSLGLFDSFEHINQFTGAPAIERGLAFVPALAGLGCPHWDRRAAGLWIGLSLGTTPIDMVRAVLEGVAWRASEVLQAMADHVDTDSALSIDGGLSSNPYFCQFLADLNQRAVHVQQSAELTALGTAMMAAGDSVSLPKQATTVYEPARTTDEYRQRFADAVNRSREWG